MEEEIDYRGHVDPDYQRWGQKYPRFPGVKECVRLLQQHNTRGVLVDIIADELQRHAAECLQEMIEVFNSEESEWVRLIILVAISDAEVPSAIPFLRDAMRQSDPRFVGYAKKGLLKIGTREARTALWEATQSDQQ